MNDIFKDTKNSNDRKQRKGNIRKILVMISVICIVFSELSQAQVSRVNAADNQVNVRVDYLEEIAYVSPGTGNSTKFYLSTDNLKTWEMLDTTNNIDISTLLSSKEVTLYFKGNKDTNPLPVVLQAPDDKLTAVYQIVNGEGRVVIGNITSPVEYRNGMNGAWKQAGIYVATSIYEVRGTTLYFRYAASSIKRAGKIISVKVPKKPSAPSVKYDGSKLAITGLKSGITQYRVGDSTVWQTFSPTDKKANSIDLYSLFFTTTPAPNTPIPEGVVEFRTKETVKSVPSSVRIIEIIQQPIVPETVSLVGTTLTITDPDKRKAYEYTLVPAGKTLNMSTARWTGVTAAKPAIIKNAAVADKIYVRAKSYTDTTTKKVVPASTYKELSVGWITL